MLKSESNWANNDPGTLDRLRGGAVCAALLQQRVVDLYEALFQSIFSEPFTIDITDIIKQRAIGRQVEEVADAASQSLQRVLEDLQPAESELDWLLGALGGLVSVITADNVSSPSASPDRLARDALQRLPAPPAFLGTEGGMRYRVALNTVLQTLTQVGPVLAEWQRLGFSKEYLLLGQVIALLEQASEHVQALSNDVGADRKYEMLYRDHLIQRFYRVDPGMVRMAVDLRVDLRAIFVMPQVVTRPRRARTLSSPGVEHLMDLTTARQAVRTDKPSKDDAEPRPKVTIHTALSAVRTKARTLIVGPPGSGKSTFLEWLQIAVASGDEALLLGERVAIPLLLRLRELDMQNLPAGTELIENATLSTELAGLAPAGWIERQLKGGWVLVMLDGLDEVSPQHIERMLGWIRDLVKQYQLSRYVISARPAAYPQSLAASLRFAVRDLCDFSPDQVREYAGKWSSAIRLLQNDPLDEALRSGELEGDEIAKAVHANRYVEDLAKNPLMLSTVCLVRHFEGGQLPDDRAVLYKLCVEGLLHYWDHQRKIPSGFQLEEKLRVCRELAIAMQTDDKAEYPTASVEHVLSTIPGNPDRTRRLFEHLIHRAGLFLERRPGVYGFVHLTFQEYMAATAIDEGNERGIDDKYLVSNCGDERWQEVLPLYMRAVTAQSARRFLRLMIAQPDTPDLATTIGNCWQAAKVEVRDDAVLRTEVVTRVASAPAQWGIRSAMSLRILSLSLGWPRWPGLPSALELWPAEEVAPIALRLVGTSGNDIGLSHAFGWLLSRPELYDNAVRSRLRGWRTLHPTSLAELVCLAAINGGAAFEEAPVGWEVLAAEGPAFRKESFATQAEPVILTILLAGHPRSRWWFSSWPVKTNMQDKWWERESYIFTLLQAIRVIDMYAPADLSKAVARLRPAFQRLGYDLIPSLKDALDAPGRSSGTGNWASLLRLILPSLADESPVIVNVSPEMRELLEILSGIAGRTSR
jgi:energy-coupling factor transporter ATP-binding protein EcfA2